MSHLSSNRVLGATMVIALLASCQAAPQAAPGAPTVVAGAPAPAIAAAPPAIARMMGYPELGLDPARSAGRVLPGFSVLADNLWGLEITTSTAAGDQTFQDMAYNTIDKNYLAVWQDSRSGTTNDIYGQLLTNTGVNTGAAFAISASTAGEELTPRIAYNSAAASNEYLVAWTDYRNGNADVYTQRVTKAGVNTGSALQLASGTGNQILAGLAYHATTNQYMVSWIDDASGSAVLKGNRVTAANAKATATELTISGTAGALGGGGIAVNGTGDYFVTWANGTTPGIYAQRVTSAGALNGSALTIASGGSYTYYTPRITYNAVTPGFMIAYERRDAATEAVAEAYVQRVTTALALSGAATAVATGAGNEMFPTLGCNASDGNYFVAWADGRAGNDSTVLYAKMFTAAGATFLSEYTASTSTTNIQARPAVAFDTTKKHFLLSWADSRNYATTGWDAYVQRVVSAPMTAQEIADETLEVLNSMEPGTAGGVNGARSQLENAIAKMLADKPDNAITHLENFISQISGISDAILSPSEKAILIALANEAINQINLGNCEGAGTC